MDEDPEIPTNETWRGIMVRARKDHGLTQGQLGAKVGVSQAMISKIETGESGGSSVIKAICSVLSIPMPEHFVDEDDRFWAQLGHLMREKAPEQYEATLQMLKSVAKAAGLELPPEPIQPERRK